jgi:hypothetical protein
MEYYYQADRFGTAIHTRKRFLIACGIQIFQQLGGINALICKLAKVSYGLSLGPDRLCRLLRHLVPEKSRLRRKPLRPHGGILEHLVLPGFVHSLVLD